MLVFFHYIPFCVRYPFGQCLWRIKQCGYVLDFYATCLNDEGNVVRVCMILERLKAMQIRFCMFEIPLRSVLWPSRILGLYFLCFILSGWNKFGQGMFGYALLSMLHFGRIKSTRVCLTLHFSVAVLEIEASSSFRHCMISFYISFLKGKDQVLRYGMHVWPIPSSFMLHF